MIMINNGNWEEDDFPLGDGVADTETEAVCPYCGEVVELTLDPGSGARQQYVEDCAVCCRPWTVNVLFDEQGRADVTLERADE
jgi:hypothetical protein